MAPSVADSKKDASAKTSQHGRLVSGGDSVCCCREERRKLRGAIYASILITMGFYVCMHVAGRKLLAHPRHPHPHEARRGGRRVNLRLLLLLLLVWRLVLMWLLLAVLHGRPSRNRIWPSHPRVSADVGGEVIPQQTATAAGTGTGTGTTACTRTGGHPLHSLETPRQGWIEDISRRRHGKACAKRGDGNNRNQLLVWVLANSKQNETALINICPRVRKS